MTGVFRARILAGRRSGSDEGIEVFGRAEGVLAYADRAAMDANVRAVLGNDDLTLEQKDQRLREYGTSVRDIFMLAALGAIPGVKVKTKKQKFATKGGDDFLKGFDRDKYRFFKGDGAVEHFDKHGSEMMNAFGKTSYNMKNYLDDAHHTIQTGTYVPELNGFVKLIGGQGSAK
ncbi:hypothetical protein ROS1_17980 [Roseibium sp. ROS1]